MQRLIMGMRFGIFIFILVLCSDLEGVQIESVGIKGGWNVSTLSASYDTGRRHTVSFGGTFDVGIYNRFGLQVEILSVGYGYENDRVLVGVDYIQVPLLATFSFMRQKYFTIELLVGPAISKKDKVSSLDKSFLPRGDRSLSLSKRSLFLSDFGTYFFDYDKGVVGGVDFEIEVFFGHIVIAPRYYWGVKRQGGGEKNRALSILMGCSMAIR